MGKFNLSRFLDVLNRVGPIFLPLVPGGDKIAVLVPVIVHAIGEAEQIQGATGPEKKAHVLSIVAAGVDVANSTGKLKLDPTEVHAVASEGIDTVISAIHVAEGARIEKKPAA